MDAITFVQVLLLIVVVAFCGGILIAMVNEGKQTRLETELRGVSGLMKKNRENAEK